MRSDEIEVRSCLCLQTRRAARNVTQIYDRALLSSGLRVTQFQLLATVAEAEPATQQMLARFLGMDRTTLTRNLALLERDGLLRVERGPEDRREHHHSLTAAGRAAFDSALPLWRSAQQHAQKNLRRNAEKYGRESFSELLGALSSLKGSSLKKL
jgi:DNA-binding MarR family transcriptional regulator